MGPTKATNGFDSWAGLLKRHGFSAAVAGILLWSILVGPNSTSAMALAVDAAASKIATAVEKASNDQRATFRDEFSKMDSQGTSRTDNAVQKLQHQIDSSLRQLQADIGKVREDSTRIREAITIIQLEYERSKKQ